MQCHGCGGYLPETTAPDASYVASPPGHCYRCKAIKAKQKEYASQPNSESYVLWPVKPKS
jgi:hypothetical protein